jgi:hypothetical protein
MYVIMIMNIFLFMDMETNMNTNMDGHGTCAIHGEDIDTDINILNMYHYRHMDCMCERHEGVYHHPYSKSVSLTPG